MKMVFRKKVKLQSNNQETLEKKITQMFFGVINMMKNAVVNFSYCENGI